MDWESDAEKAMQNVPFFVRRMAKAKVEELARSRNRQRVTLQDVHDSRKQTMGTHGGTSSAVTVLHQPVSANDRASDISVSEELAGPVNEPTMGGLTESHIRRIEELVEKTGGFESRFISIKGCGGAVGCPLTLIDVAKVTERLKERVDGAKLSEALAGQVRGPVLSHHKFKAAVAGCANCCSEPQIKDFAVVAEARPERGPEECIDCGACVDACKEGAVNLLEGGPVIDASRCVHCGDCAAACPTGSLVSRQGYTILVGGKLGRRPQLAVKLVELADEETVYKALDACIALIKEEGRGGERLGAILDRVGLQALRDRLVHVSKMD
ncbi:MAG: 4Fe-4S binding protein [Chloroflexi bacterium]|nr:4Fe-4S binding protein [Chloroflexota bacterium]MDA8188309.1 4Fe-4S binding protein [Dehalococcoidales bacterium]